MDQLTNIRKPIHKELETFSAMFDEMVGETDGTLHNICRGIADHKGKLMRPMLLLLVAKEYGRVGEATYFSALTLELLHNASLVHDDIVDESDERRGRPSVRAVYGNKVGVLAGDYLLSSSLEHAAKTGNIHIVNDIANLGKHLSQGEIIQLSNTQKSDFSESSYYDIIRLKTASLFSSAARLGALSVGAGEGIVNRMNRMGEIIGICFQIRDDIFDYFSSDIGKPTGNDMLEGKLTLPVLYALNHSGNTEMQALALKVREGHASKDDIASLVQFTKAEGGIEYATTCMDRYATEAQNLIRDFAHPDIKEALTAYIHFVCRRKI